MVCVLKMKALRRFSTKDVTLYLSLKKNLLIKTAKNILPVPEICFGCLNINIVKVSLIRLVCSASWSNGNAFVSEVGGLSFNSRGGQNRNSFANGSPPLQYFFRKALNCLGARTRKWSPQTRYTPRSNTANIKKKI